MTYEEAAVGMILAEKNDGSSPSSSFSAIDEISNFDILCEVEIAEGWSIRLVFVPWNAAFANGHSVSYNTHGSTMYKGSETFRCQLYIVCVQNGIPIAAIPDNHDYDRERNMYGYDSTYANIITPSIYYLKYKTYIKNVTAAGSYWGSAYEGVVTFTATFTLGEREYGFDASSFDNWGPTGEYTESESTETVEVYATLADRYHRSLASGSGFKITRDTDMWKLEKSLLSAVYKRNLGYGIDDIQKIAEITEPKN